MDIKACRLCCENKATIPIFEYTVDSVELYKKIIHCFKYAHLHKDDGLPALVCGDCEQQVYGYYEFVLRCEAAEKKLRSLLSLCSVNPDELDVKDEVDIDNNGKQDFKDELPIKQIELHESVKIKVELTDSNINKKLEGYKGYNKELTKELIQDKSENVILYTSCKTKKKMSKYKEMNFTCSVCGRICINRSTLGVHMSTHNNERPYPCSSCDKSYKHSGTLKRHVSRNHLKEKRKRNFICESCGKSFFTKNVLTIHMRTHTGETPYACPICPGKFTQISALIRHKRRHAGDKTHTCQECSKSFCTKEELKNHLLIHSNEKKFSCPICKIPFRYQNNLNKHIKTHTEKDKFICNYCGCVCTRKSNLKVHIDHRHSEKSGHCTTCSKSFSNIEAHMWRHTGERPLKCELCTSSFFQLKALAHHISFKHKKTDKYKCDVEGCLKTFPSSLMLHFHTEKFHSTHIPFPCDKCSRRFYRINDLARHKIGTHKEKLK